MTFSERVSTFLKSLSGAEGKKKEDDQKPAQGAEDESGDVTIPVSDNMGKSDMVDATDILTSLAAELKSISESLAALVKKQDGIEKSQADFGEAVVGVAEMISKIANSPVPTKSVLEKGGLGSNQGSGQPAGLTKAEFEVAQQALSKSFKAGHMSIGQCSRLESEMQKSLMIAGYKMRPEDIAAVAQALKTA